METTVARTPFQAWLAWLCDRRLAGARGAHLVSLLGRRERTTLLLECFLRWQASRADDREVKVRVMRERLERADAECCLLRSQEERSRAEVRHWQAQAESGHARSQRVEAELLRRSDEEFARLRVLEKELSQLQAEASSRAATAMPRGGSSRGLADHGLKAADLPLAVRQGASAAVARAAAWCTETLTLEALLRLYLLAWSACAAMGRLSLAALEQCTACELATASCQVLSAWRLIVDRGRLRRRALRRSLGSGGQWPLQSIGSRLSMKAILYLWRMAVKEVGGQSRRVVSPRVEAAKSDGSALDRTQAWSLPECSLRQQGDVPAVGRLSSSPWLFSRSNSGSPSPIVSARGGGGGGGCVGLFAQAIESRVTAVAAATPPLQLRPAAVQRAHSMPHSVGGRATGGAIAAASPSPPALPTAFPWPAPALQGLASTSTSRALSPGRAGGGCTGGGSGGGGSRLVVHCGPARLPGPLPAVTAGSSSSIGGPLRGGGSGGGRSVPAS